MIPIFLELYRSLPLLNPIPYLQYLLSPTRKTDSLHHHIYSFVQCKIHTKHVPELLYPYHYQQKAKISLLLLSLD